MNPILHAPVASDYATLASWISDATACARWAGPSLRFPFAAHELPQLLHSEQSRSYSMADEGGALLGFGQFWPRGKNTTHLGRIIVALHMRGRGLGRTLMELLIGEAIRTARPERITMRVYKYNEAALALYTSFGFVAVMADSSADILTMAKMIRTDV